MPSFSQNSQARLATCDPRLQSLFNAVVQHFDCSILEGHRGEERQNQMVAEGKSQTLWPNSQHNSQPSMAADVAPYPIDWDDRERLTLFAGYVLGMGRAMGISIRWGGDWDRDTQVRDNTFDDLVHFEIDE